MVPGAPDIDTFVDMSARFSSRLLILEGGVRGDAFPNAEVFVYDGVGKSVMVWDFTTTGGADTGPFTMLAGSGASNHLGRFYMAIALQPSGGFF